MPYINQSPWLDAGNYGEGLGNTLAAALVRLPMERAQFAMQERDRQEGRDIRAQQVMGQQAHWGQQQQLATQGLGLKLQALQSQADLNRAHAGFFSGRAAEQQANAAKAAQVQDLGNRLLQGQQSTTFPSVNPNPARPMLGQDETAPAMSPEQQNGLARVMMLLQGKSMPQPKPAVGFNVPPGNIHYMPDGSSTTNMNFRPTVPHGSTDLTQSPGLAAAFTKFATGGMDSTNLPPYLQRIYTNQPSATPMAAPNPVAAPTPQIRVQHPNGQTGTYLGTPDQAVAEGYKVIQ